MDLEFINLSDPREIRSRDSRRRVRSHAMRHVHNRKRLAPRRGRSNQNIQPEPGPENVPRIFPRSIAWYSSQPVEAEDAGGPVEDYEDIAGVKRMEQLDVYPVSSTERYMFTIFHHCK
jgi:hypothetical protein